MGKQNGGSRVARNSSDQTLTKVRELLLGEHVSDTERLLHETRVKLEQNAKTIESGLTQGITDLRNELSTTTTQLMGRVNTEHQDRSKSFQAVQQKLSECSDAFLKKIDSLSAELRNIEQDTRTLLQNEVIRLQEEHRSVQQQFKNEFTALNRQINSEKVGKESLAQVLREMATHVEAKGQPAQASESNTSAVNHIARDKH